MEPRGQGGEGAASPQNQVAGRKGGLAGIPKNEGTHEGSHHKEILPTGTIWAATRERYGAVPASEGQKEALSMVFKPQFLHL